MRNKSANIFEPAGGHRHFLRKRRSAASRQGQHRPDNSQPLAQPPQVSYKNLKLQFISKQDQKLKQNLSFQLLHLHKLIDFGIDYFSKYCCFIYKKILNRILSIYGNSSLRKNIKCLIFQQSPACYSINLFLNENANKSNYCVYHSPQTKIKNFMKRKLFA